MGHYRPRPSQTRSCSHCGTSFLSSHKRTQYCGESCRQLAYQARRRTHQPPVPTASTAGQLSFSVQNVGVTTAGSVLVALTNYLVNDRPAQQAVITQLNQLTQRVDQLTQALQASGVPVPGDPAPVRSPAAEWNLPPTMKPMTLDELADELALKNSQHS